MTSTTMTFNLYNQIRGRSFDVTFLATLAPPLDLVKILMLLKIGIFREIPIGLGLGCYTGDVHGIDNFRTGKNRCRP